MKVKEIINFSAPKKMAWKQSITDNTFGPYIYAFACTYICYKRCFGPDIDKKYFEDKFLEFNHVTQQ